MVVSVGLFSSNTTDHAHCALQTEAEPTKTLIDLTQQDASQFTAVLCAQYISNILGVLSHVQARSFTELTVRGVYFYKPVTLAVRARAHGSLMTSFPDRQRCSKRRKITITPDSKSLPETSPMHLSAELIDLTDLPLLTRPTRNSTIVSDGGTRIRTTCRHRKTIRTHRLKNLLCVTAFQARSGRVTSQSINSQ